MGSTCNIERDSMLRMRGAVLGTGSSGVQLVTGVGGAGMGSGVGELDED